MFDLYEEIAKVDSYEIQGVLEAVIDRYHALFPDWEIGTFSLERNKDKHQQLDEIIQLFENMKSKA